MASYTSNIITGTTSGTNINPTYNPTPNYGGYTQGYTQGQYTFPAPYPNPNPFPSVPAAPHGYVEGLEEIVEELGIKPVEDEGFTAGICVNTKDGVRYSLVAIIKAHLDLMKQLHILAAHTDLLIPKERREDHS